MKNHRLVALFTGSLQAALQARRRDARCRRTQPDYRQKNPAVRVKNAALKKLKQLQSTPLRKRRMSALKHATSSAATCNHQPAIALRHVCRSCVSLLWNTDEGNHWDHGLMYVIIVLVHARRRFSLRLRRLFSRLEGPDFPPYGVSDEHRKDRAPGPVRAALGY